MTANAAPSQRLRLAPVARAAAACALIGTSVAVAREDDVSLRAALASRHVDLLPGSVHWIDAHGFDARHALVIAREPGQPTDVFAVTARTGADDRIIEVTDVSNLTRSPNASEDTLVVGERFAAFVTRVGGQAVAFTRIDCAGDRSGGVVDRSARVRSAITRWQQTGRPRGYGFDRFDLRVPAPTVSLGIADDVLTVHAGEARIVVDAAGRIVSGADFVRERPRISAQSDNWITWAVDSVRAIPWIGSAPIAWAEGLAFSARHVARRARAAVRTTSTAETTQREVAEDLADVLAIRSTGALEGPVTDWPPARLASPVGPPVEHEGEWSPVARDDDPFVQQNPGSPPSMFVTFVRTDRELDDSRAYVLVWDPRQVELHVAPGSQEPMGATGETGSGVIPRDVGTMSRLVGAFNGAFQGLHGEYGVYAEGTLLLPPKPYAATIADMSDGSTGFGSWPAEQHEIPVDIVEFRQNLTAMIDAGVYNPWHREDWGPVLNNPGDLRTARSGICLTSESYVAFFWGNDLNPHGLADAMLAARCSYGIHLDMNGANTGFDFYRVGANGSLPPVGHRIEGGYEAEGAVDELPGLTFRARRLVRGMQHQASRYIHRNVRDFFYLLLRPVLPGPALSPVVTPASPGEGTWHVAGLGSVPFPWPMARTRLRPDATQPDRWVNLVRVDPRRVTLAPADAAGAVVARFVGASGVTDAGPPRLTMTQGPAGPQWSIGTEGTGIAGQSLQAGMNPLRGACIDEDGFLVLVVADRAVPDLVSHALDRAGCTATRLALGETTLVLPSGDTVAGETARVATAPPVFALITREFSAARRIFPEVTPVAHDVWYPVQTRRVRYFPNPGNNVSVQVRLSGQQPTVFRLPGIGAQYVQQAYPDGGAPPEIHGTN